MSVMATRSLFASSCKNSLFRSSKSFLRHFTTDFSANPETLAFPKEVRLGDITIRDGFQHEEKFIPTSAKVWIAEQAILAGYRDLEITNFGNPRGMPQFSDADELFTRVRKSPKIQHLLPDCSLTAVTIRERAVERALKAYQDGVGPDRILMMVSTSESHHKTNSGISIEEYFKMAEGCIEMAKSAGVEVCGTVSTIWGCPIEGPTELQKAVDFTQRWLDMGATTIEHADHDGSAPPNEVYRYFNMIRNQCDDPSQHIVHLHELRGWGNANVLAALMAGMTYFESTMGGIGGQPANFVDGSPVAGTGAYYYKDAGEVGLVGTEDMVVMMDEMGIDTGLDVDHILRIGAMVEKIVGRKLRAETLRNGRVTG